MAQGGMFGGGNVSPRMLMAQQLLAQGGSGAPVQHWTQGLNRLAQALVGARMAGMDSRDEQAAMAALGQGISAPQWVNPDTGTPEARASNVAGAPMVPTPQAGGYEGAIAALGGLQGNRMAQDLMSRLAMGKFESDIASKQKLQELMAKHGLESAESDRDRAATFENQKALAAMRDAAALERTKISASAQGGASPMNVREWEFFKSLPSDQDRQDYLNMKRAAQYADTGGEIVRHTPALETPTQTVAVKTLPPEKMPENIAAAESARTTAESQAKRTATMSGLGDIIDSARVVLEGDTKPTASGAGAKWNEAAAFFGISPEGAAEADKMKAIGGALVAKMPRMEGPQSNFDVQNYREMAGQVGDPTIPIERRLAALEEVERLWRKYDKGGPSQPAPQQGPGEYDGFRILRQK